MEGTATPRITCAYLNSYVGKHVIVVGKVVQLRGDEAVIDADGNITAHLNRVRNLSPLPPPGRDPHDLSAITLCRASREHRYPYCICERDRN